MQILMHDYRHPERFLGLDDAFSQREASAVWVLPIPLDMTTSSMGGPRLGPSALIEASNRVVLYDDTLGADAAPLYGVHTLPTLHPELASQQEAIESITAEVNALGLGDRLLVTLGGEHSITPGVVAAFAPRFPDLIVVQIDAHHDLRDPFGDIDYGSACAMRRLLPLAPVLQFGVRTFSDEEVRFARHSDRVTVWTGEAMHRDRDRRYLSALREAIAGHPVYLTIDLSGLDPSIMPAVATPEPGGIGWYDCLDLIRTVAEHGQIVAFDCVELCPQPGSHASNYAAARLVYKTINTIMASRGKVTPQ